MNRLGCCWALILLLVAADLPAAGVSILDYGAIPDDGQDDTAAIQAAIDAVDNGGMVRVPAGVYQVAVSGKIPAILCAKSVQLVGDGLAQSIIRTEPELTDTGFVFRFEAGTQVTVQALSIEGPQNVGAFYCRPIWHLAGPGGSLQIKQAKISGGTHGVILEEVDGRLDFPQLTVLDSQIQSSTGLHHAGSGSMYVARTEFSNYGLVGSNKRHAIYVYRSVALTVDRCVFDGGVGDSFDIQVYSPTAPVLGSLTVQNSTFQSKAPARGILTHLDTRSTISSCRLGEATIWVQQGGADIIKCSLQTRSQVAPWPYAPGEWTFQKCTFAR